MARGGGGIKEGSSRSDGRSWRGANGREGSRGHWRRGREIATEISDLDALAPGGRQRGRKGVMGLNSVLDRSIRYLQNELESSYSLHLFPLYPPPFSSVRVPSE